MITNIIDGDSIILCKLLILCGFCLFLSLVI
jgi:hypothetical protein